MNDLCGRIVAMYKAETGITLRVALSYEAGTKVPWRATIGVYNAVGTEPYSTLEVLLGKLEQALQVKRRMHHEAIGFIDDALV